MAANHSFGSRIGSSLMGTQALETSGQRRWVDLFSPSYCDDLVSHERWADSTSKRVVCGQFWRIICSELLALIQSSVKLWFFFLLKRVMAADGELQCEFQREITVNGGPCCLPSISSKKNKKNILTWLAFPNFSCCPKNLSCPKFTPMVFSLKELIIVIQEL